MLKKLILLFLMFSAAGASANDVCFSPGKCSDKLVSFVASAKKSVDVAVYLLTYKPISDALIAQHKNGVTVRVVVDAGESGIPTSKVAALAAAGIPVKYGVQSGSGIMHDKFIVVDGTMLETGSFNFTQSATMINQENQVYLNDASIVALYVSHFNAMWVASSVTKKVKK